MNNRGLQHSQMRVSQSAEGVGPRGGKGGGGEKPAGKERE